MKVQLRIVSVTCNVEVLQHAASSQVCTHLKMFLCLEFGYQEVHIGNDTFTAVRMAKHVVRISSFHKYVFTDRV